jgi:hemoglobin-like flavoprotein
LYASDNQLKKNVPIISEKVSDIVFQDPTETFYKILEEHPQTSAIQVQTEQRKDKSIVELLE